MDENAARADGSSTSMGKESTATGKEAMEADDGFAKPKGAVDTLLNTARQARVVMEEISGFYDLLDKEQRRADPRQEFLADINSQIKTLESVLSQLKSSA